MSLKSMPDPSRALVELLVQTAVSRPSYYDCKGLASFTLLVGMFFAVLLSATRMGGYHVMDQGLGISMASRSQQLMQPGRASLAMQPARIQLMRPTASVVDALTSSNSAPSAEVDQYPLPRRAAVGVLGAGLAGFAQQISSLPARADEEAKIVVFGGDGFIGSRVCKQLLEINPATKVVAVSRTRAESPFWAAKTKWSKQVDWIAADALTADFAPLLDGATAVISCIGALGSEDDEKVNGQANVRLADAAAKANVQRFVYISVNPLVNEAAAGLKVLPEYFKGKQEAESAVKADFGTKASTIVRPTLVYGGDVFNVSPPRVPSYWGSFVETVLSSTPFRLLADLSAPIPALKVALLPPVDVDTCARAVAEAALGEGDGGDVIGTDAIKALAYAKVDAMTKTSGRLR